MSRAIVACHDGNGERIACIIDDFEVGFAEGEPNHLEHGLFIGEAVTRNAELHFVWGIFADEDVAFAGGEEDDAAGLRDGDRGFLVCREIEFFDGHGIRLVFFDERVHFVFDFNERAWVVDAFDFEDAGSEKFEGGRICVGACASALASDDAIANPPRTRINPEESHGWSIIYLWRT